MNVNHTISSIDKSTGGPARSVTHLMSKILEISDDISLDLTTLYSEKPIIRKFNKENSNIFFFNNTIKYKKKYDLYHAQGIWQMPMHKMAKEARKKNRPYIITPSGMLEPWSLTQGRIKKLIALKLFQYKDLSNAFCLHATSVMEVESIRKLGLKNPVAMIPNGININEFPDSLPVKVSGKKKILFLSRVHKKKGIEILIKAWLGLDLSLKKDWIIEIVGNGDLKYIEKIKKIIIKQNLENQIFVLPPVFGEKKIQLYRDSSLFVLPTYSENFGVVIAEALASYTPVITTKGAPWDDLERFNCGWWIDIGIKPLQSSLIKAMSCKEEDLIVKGKNGRNLIKEKYSIESVAKKMIKLYSWILNKTDKPPFINTI